MRVADQEAVCTWRAQPSQLVRVVAYNGNLLLNIGPAADGRIPFIFQERLRQIGAWMAVNEEAIFETTYWPVAQRENGTNIYYTRKETAPVLHAILLDWPDDNVVRLAAPVPTAQTVVTLLGYPQGALTWAADGPAGMLITLPFLTPKTIPCDHAWTLRLTNLANLGDVPAQ